MNFSFLCFPHLNSNYFHCNSFHLKRDPYSQDSTSPSMNSLPKMDSIKLNYNTQVSSLKGALFQIYSLQLNRQCTHPLPKSAQFRSERSQLKNLLNIYYQGWMTIHVCNIYLALFRITVAGILNFYGYLL